MYASGMRSQEVCDLTVGDIQFYQDKACINVHGKGQKILNITVRRSRQSGVARATCPD